MPAENFNDAFNTLRKYLIDTVDYETYYTSRKHSPIPKLARRLKIDDSKSKVLFTGHRGSGKTTELFRLMHELDDEFLVVYYSMKENFNLSEVTHTHVLISIGLKIYEIAIKKDLRINRDIVEKLEKWMIDTTKITSEEIKASVSTEAGIGTIFAKISSVLRAEGSSRVEFREEIERKTPDLIELINDLISEVYIESRDRLHKKDLLIIIDDLDKPDLKIAEEIFYKHADSLTQPMCKIIYTIPIALVYSKNYKQMEQMFDGIEILPMVKTLKKDGTRYEDGIGELKEILSKRMDLDLFDQEALEYLIMKTGGIIRDLLNLSADCCLTASLKADTESDVKIDSSIVHEALSELRNDYRRMLTVEDYEKLETIKERKDSDKDESLMGLLHSLSVLYYLNDDCWYDVHPVIDQLLEDRKKKV